MGEESRKRKRKMTEEEEQEAYFERIPLGFRFCPTDEELLVEYLAKKVYGLPLPRNRIVDVNIYDFNPHDLEERHKIEGEKYMYFFTPRGRKHPYGSRPSRSAGLGFWKATGSDIEVSSGNEVVGFKKALVFYKRSGGKTNWIMHEFTLARPSPPKPNGQDMRLDEQVLCRIYQKEVKGESNDLRILMHTKASSSSSSQATHNPPPPA